MVSMDMVKDASHGQSQDQLPADQSDATTDTMKVAQKKATASASSISKSKGFRVMRVKNDKTERMNQLYVCLSCDKIFSKMCNMKDHVRSHAPERQFACQYCKQSFTLIGNRNRH